MNIKGLIRESLKRPLREPYRAALRRLKSLQLTVSYRMPSLIAPHFCPVCGRGLRRFQVIKWGDTMCVFCGSVQRFRMAWLYLLRRTDLFDGRLKSMLHIAPEEPFRDALSGALGAGYVTADLLKSDVRLRMDITAIPFPAETFDVIYCSHVLEHVPEDGKAMREFARVLKPNGWVFIQVPCFPEIGKTQEDFSVTDPAERLRLYGQEDHVRVYGDDLVSRLENAGFNVSITQPVDLVDAKEGARFDLFGESADVYLCTKRQAEG